MGTERTESGVIEKRKHPRKDASLEYKIEDLEKEFDTQGVTMNLSTHGVLCTVDRPIPEMTELKILLKLPSGYAECQGTVVRVNKCHDARGKYTIAIYINHIAPGDRAKIADFVGG